ncbi:MAG: Holliday junction resolvase RuvX [Chloroflexi bacterium]|nr:Holliday junction resolvase RuvX [Chloroflexota bacterium]
MSPRALGLDVGDRRIGVAISDPEGLIAVPLTTVQKRDAEAAALAVADIVRKNEVGSIVVGLPALLSGEIGEQARKVEEFVERLKPHLSVPVEWWDERLSTVAAEKMMRETGATRVRRDANRDALAAALVLQAYLDSKRIQG